MTTLVQKIKQLETLKGEIAAANPERVLAANMIIARGRKNAATRAQRQIDYCRREYPINLDYWVRVMNAITTMAD